MRLWVRVTPIGWGRDHILERCHDQALVFFAWHEYDAIEHIMSCNCDDVVESMAKYCDDVVNSMADWGHNGKAIHVSTDFDGRRQQLISSFM
jgi:hypothetical protein